MTENGFLAALRSRESIPVAVWVTLPSTSVVEMLGNHGVDVALIDLEHTSFTVATVEALVLAAELAGVTPLVRVPAAAHDDVNRVLDAGAAGIVFPLISTGDEAEAAARVLRYPPRGTRGWGGRHIRRVRWSGPEAMQTTEYLRAVEESLANVIMIETPEGVANVAEILERGAPDGVIFGLADFSVAVGFDDEQTHAAARRVYAECRARGVGLGLIPGSPAAELAPGDFCVAGVDSLLINDAIGACVRRVKP